MSFIVSTTRRDLAEIETNGFGGNEEESKNGEDAITRETNGVGDRLVWGIGRLGDWD